jgi:hypothetical protein
MRKSIVAMINKIIKVLRLNLGYNFKVSMTHIRGDNKRKMCKLDDIKKS